MWNTNVAMTAPGESHGEVFPTRAHFIGEGTLAELVGFTTAQHRQAVAAHELGHFLVHWKLGARVHSIAIEEDGENIIPGGVVSFSYPKSSEIRPILVGGAAGERACDRWLREQGLWTPARAVYGEIQGQTDRTDAQKQDPSITFDGGPNDYRHLQDEADQVLDDVWPLLLRGLGHFREYAAYTGDFLCRRIGICNNPSA